VAARLPVVETNAGGQRQPPVQIPARLFIGHGASYNLTMPYLGNPDEGWYKRYNTLRLLGYDYSSQDRPLFVTLDANGMFPVFAELGFAKRTLGALLSEQTLARIRLHVFCLMPDHLHLLFNIKGAPDSLATFLYSFKSFTTQLCWKRGQEIARGTQPVQHAPLEITPSGPAERSQLRRALSEWRITLRPECVRLKQFPKPSLRDFQHKTLWKERGFDHVIRNQDDFRETVKYILNNPVERGYVDRPEHYPFSGVLMK
jgi:REP element-mobilizing transposase RayT